MSSWPKRKTCIYEIVWSLSCTSSTFMISTISEGGKDSRFRILQTNCADRKDATISSADRDHCKGWPRYKYISLKMPRKRSFPICRLMKRFMVILKHRNTPSWSCWSEICCKVIELWHWEGCSTLQWWTGRVWASHIEAWSVGSRCQGWLEAWFGSRSQVCCCQTSFSTRLKRMKNASSLMLTSLKASLLALKRSMNKDCSRRATWPWYAECTPWRHWVSDSSIKWIFECPKAFHQN